MCEFGWDILRNNKVFHTKCWFRTDRSAKRRICTKFHQDSFKTERLVCIEIDIQTDGQTDGQRDGQTDGHGYIDSTRRPDQEYIHFLGSVRPRSIRYKQSDQI